MNDFDFCSKMFITLAEALFFIFTIKVDNYLKPPSS